MMEAVGVLADGIAHGFNNLPTVINGYWDLLLPALAGDDAKRADIEKIKQAGMRAEAFTAQLLAFSSKPILQPEVVNLNEAIAEAAGILRRLIREDVILVVHTCPDLGLVRADPV